MDTEAIPYSTKITARKRCMSIVLDAKSACPYMIRLLYAQRHLISRAVVVSSLKSYPFPEHTSHYFPPNESEFGFRALRIRSHFQLCTDGTRSARCGHRTVCPISFRPPVCFLAAIIPQVISKSEENNCSAFALLNRCLGKRVPYWPPLPVRRSL